MNNSKLAAAALLAASLAAVASPDAAAQGIGIDLYQNLVNREQKVMPARERIFYGKELPQFGDLRLPKGPGPFPLAIVVHGGAWGSAVSLHYTSPLAAALTCAGFATWNYEYRRMGGGGGWPQTFQDVGAGADYARELAKRYPLDLNNVISIGHSSGGHMALWLAARRKLASGAVLYAEGAVPLKGVVSLSGPGDIKRFMELIPRFADVLVQVHGGGTPENLAKNLKEGSPAELLPLGVPQIFITGDKDPAVPIQEAREYSVKASSAGDKVEVISVPGLHFESVDPGNATSGPEILNAALKLAGMTGDVAACVAESNGGR
ncbi:MAG: alpha/beta hydrolase [Pseudorhodoplanes sp.]